MFGRSEKQATTTAPVIDKPGGKGRPTPSRKEAQALAKERARAGTDTKAATKADRAKRAEHNARMRQGMKNGEEKYLMERDKGPVRRFVRDYVDTRISVMEFLLPLLVVIMVLQGIGGSSTNGDPTALQSASQLIWVATILLLLTDVFALNFRLGRELKARFPDDNVRGWRFYAFMRSIQIRPLRLPKPQRKYREKLPDRY